MKTLKVLLQEVVSGIKAWVNSNFAQESNAVHKTGDETVNGEKTFTRNVLHQNSRSIYRNTNISRETTPEAYTAVDTYSHLGADWAYWGGLKHLWFADGQSTLQLAVANHKLNGSTWSQGFWAVNLSASKDFYSVNFAPSNNNAINLGTADYQWYNLYAKNYFYNGTQWGLDQANTWTNTNTFVGNIGLVTYKSNEIDRTQHTDSNYRYVTQVVQDKNGEKLGECFWGYKASTDEAFASFWVTASDGLGNDTGHRGGIYISHHGSTGITDVHPTHLNGTNLGTSTNKWKSFNGINPGELSLPEGGNATSIAIDITDWYVQDPDYPNDPSKKILDGTEHEVETSVPGWLHVQFENVAGNFAYARQYSAGKNMADEKIANGLATDNFPMIFFVYPIHTKLKVSIKSKSASVRIFPCLGNV